MLTMPWVYDLFQIKTMLPGEHQQVLSNLQSRFDDFVEDSQESKIFTSSDTAQLEREVSICKQYYQELLKSAERGKLPLHKRLQFFINLSSSELLLLILITWFFEWIKNHCFNIVYNCTV